MAIETYEFDKLTQVIKDIFPVKKCDQLFCDFNFNSLSKYLNMTSGFLTGNDYAVKQVRTFGRGDPMDGTGGSIEDEDDFSSPSKFLYYNTDKKEGY